MRTKPIQLTDAAFPMLRKAISRLDEGTGLRVGAADIVPAAELIEAGYVEYMRMIDDLTAPRGRNNGLGDRH